MRNTYYPQLQVFALFGFFFLFSLNLLAQVGIGDQVPVASSLLDINDSDNDKGILIPRVDIANLTTKAPVTTTTIGESLLVYNTNTATGKGFYYWNGTNRWVRITRDNDWKLTGNSGTTAGTNFIGTRDNVHFELFTYNSSRMRIQNNGQITMGFGTDMANANQQVNIKSTYIDGDAVGGYSDGSGSGVYGQNISSGNGVFGQNISSGNGVYGRTEGVGAAVKGESAFYWPFGYIGYSVEGLGAPIFSDNILSGKDAFFGETRDDISNALWVVNNAAAGVGVLGANNDLSVSPPNGVGVSGSGTKLGIYGYAGAGEIVWYTRGNSAGLFTLDTDSNPKTDNGANTGNRASAKLAGLDNAKLISGGGGAKNFYFGGYLSGGNENSGTRSYVYVGLKYNSTLQGTVGTNYKILGNGTNSTLINDAQGNPRIMFSPEAPEILFQDYGVGKLVNGQARINIDPILKRSLYVDNEHPLKVFVGFEGDCKGIYVTDKSIDGFTVKEFKNGRSNVSFTWQIVANRADDKDANGNISSKHVGLRLPIGPSPIETPKSAVKFSDKIYNLEKDTKQPTATHKSGEKLSEEELMKIRRQVSIGDEAKQQKISE